MEMPARSLLGATVRSPPWSILVERDVHWLRPGTWNRAAIGNLNRMAVIWARAMPTIPQNRAKAAKPNKPCAGASDTRWHVGNQSKVERHSVSDLRRKHLFFSHS
jgi:hypothetical protein